MQLNCGIVGLPNVGKSTLFSALTSAPAEAANYPFCTIEPNVGLVAVPDNRLKRIAELFNPKSLIPTVTEFVDIAGLVKGASKGEGLGNQFLGHIRQVGAIIHVVRCFDNDDIVHVHGKIDPLDDIETVEFELALADLETVEKRMNAMPKLIKSQDKKISEQAKATEPILQLLIKTLEAGKPARSLALSPEQKVLIQDLHLITSKNQIYCCNVDEASVVSGNAYVETVKKYAEQNGSEVIMVCAQLESEIAKLDDPEERALFLADVGIEESGLDKLIRAGYHSLNLRTFFTAGEKEVRAWTFEAGMKAPQTAGVIHTDFERGFIRAEVYHCEDLFSLGSEAKIKEQGKLRVEGKEYVVQDGDVMFFRFNV